MYIVPFIDIAMVSRSSIDEANRHLQALHVKVQELEKTVQDQSNTIMYKDKELKEKVLEINESKDSEITELTAKLLSAKDRLNTFETLLREKDKVIDKLQERCQILDRVMTFQPTLENLLTTLASGGNVSDSGISDVPPEDLPYHGAKLGGYRGSAIRRMAKNFNSHSGRRKQFSISEDDDEDQNADTEGDSSDEKSHHGRELYL